MIPLRDNVIVKIDESRATECGIVVPHDTNKWLEARKQLGNRGVVLYVGAGKRHEKTAVLLKPQCRVGDVVRFSELEYPYMIRDGAKYVMINDMDIVGIETHA